MTEKRPLGGLRLPSTRDMAWNMVQLGSLALAVALAYIIRFEGILDTQNIDSLSSCLGILVPVQFFMLLAVAGGRSSIRGLTLRDLWQLIFGVTMGLGRCRTGSHRSPKHQFLVASGSLTGSLPSHFSVACVVQHVRLVTLFADVHLAQQAES
jgi:hypothetical protein